MQFLRKTIALIFLLLLVFVTIPVALLTAITRTYLNPNFYETTRFRETVYEAVTQEFAERILSKSPEIKLYFNIEEIDAMLQQAVTPETVNETIDDVFEQLASEPFPERVTISTTEIRKNIPEIIETLSTKVPGNKTEIEAELTTQLESAIPEEIHLSTEAIHSKNRTALLLILNNNDLILRGFMALITGFVALIGLIIWRPLRVVCAWLGATLAVDGFSLLAWTLIIRKSMTNMPWTTMDPTRVLTVLKPIFDQMNVYGLFLVGASVLFFGGHFVLKHQKR